MCTLTSHKQLRRANQTVLVLSSFTLVAVKAISMHFLAWQRAVQHQAMWRANQHLLLSWARYSPKKVYTKPHHKFDVRASDGWQRERWRFAIIFTSCLMFLLLFIYVKRRRAVLVWGSSSESICTGCYLTALPWADRKREEGTPLSCCSAG